MTEPVATDVATPSQPVATDVAQEGGTPPEGEGTPATVTKPGDVDPNNVRGGKSRSEKRQEKVDSFIDKQMSKAEETTRTEAVKEVVKGLPEANQAAASENYSAEVAKLTEHGVSPEKAHEIALGTVTKAAEAAAVAAADAEKAKGRGNAQIPPAGTGDAPTQTTYTQEQLSKMPTAQAVQIRKDAHAGKVNIVFE